MAASPIWKVYSATGEYLAACKYVEDAAAVVAAHGEGTQIRLGHASRAAVWTEGKEEQPAGESYDGVVATVLKRVETLPKRPRYAAGDELSPEEVPL
jgi:hypothetical protein